jgi:hypothetical protein
MKTYEPTHLPTYEHTKLPTNVPTSTPTVGPKISTFSIAVGITVGAVLIFVLSAFLLWNFWTPQIKPEASNDNTNFQTTGLPKNELQPLIGSV